MPPDPRPLRARAAALWARARDRVHGLGDRAGLDARLVDFAVRFPLTRPIARRRAGALFDLCAGFAYSQVLAACVELDLFARLAAGPRASADLAPALGLAEPEAVRLLEAAASLRLVRRAGPGRYRLGPLGRAVLLDPGIPAMVRHHALVYRDLADPVALLRGEGPGPALRAFWSYSRGGAPGPGDGSTEAYTTLMAASQAMVSREVLRAYPFARHRRMVDVGGGDGSFVEAVARAAPALDLTLFDLPPVAEAARARFARAGLDGRARAVGGDARRGPLPRGADLMTLVRVLHDHEDGGARDILRAARGALGPGATVLVAEPTADGVERVGAAYFGLYLLAMGQGRARAAPEIAALLEGAGFASVRRRPTALPLVVSVITAQVPRA